MMREINIKAYFFISRRSYVKSSYSILKHKIKVFCGVKYKIDTENIYIDFDLLLSTIM